MVINGESLIQPTDFRISAPLSGFCYCTKTTRGALLNMRMTTHISPDKKTGIMAYRRRIPGDLVAILGTKPIFKSLGTRSYKEAVRLSVAADGIDTMTEKRIADARRQLGSRTDIVSEPAAYAALASWRVSEGARAGDCHFNGIRYPDSAHHAALLAPEPWNAVADYDQRIAEVLRQGDIMVAPDHPCIGKLREPFRQEWLTIIRRAEGISNWLTPLTMIPATGQAVPVNTLSTSQAPGSTPSDRDTPSKVVELYIVTKPYIRAKAVLRAYARHLGDVMGEYRGAPTETHVVTMRDLLKTIAAIPTKEQRAMSLQERATATTPKQKLVGSSTINSGLEGLARVYKFAKVPFPGDCKIVAPKGTPKSKPRESFLPAHLPIIFNSPIFTENWRTQGGRGEAAKWMPLLAAFTGARRNELGQLLLTDVKEKDGIWYLSITTLDDDGNVVKTVKTDNSVRDVPIAQLLIDLGFLDYWRAERKAGGEKLFPLLDHRKMHPQLVSANWGDWFNTHLWKHLGLPRGYTFHCFRHSFIDQARPVMGDVMIALLTGHISQSVKGTGENRNYGGSLAALNEAIQKVNYGPELTALLMQMPRA